MLINSEIDEVLDRFPDLTFHHEKNELSGSLNVGNNDVYDVAINLDSYPLHFPKVWETSERIPKEVHRHIYTDTGSCCFTTAAKAQILLKTSVKSLLSFVQDILIPYLQNNSYYEITGEYSFDEYSHNTMGIVESYKDILGIKNVYHIVELIKGRLRGEKLRPQSLCYCGSLKTLKKCSGSSHAKAYRNFRRIDKNILFHDLIHTFEPLRRRS